MTKTMTDAPELYDMCACCGKRIAKKRSRIITTETSVICCIHCVFDDSKRAHKVAYPECPVDWHDIYDHQHAHATRAAAKWILAKGGWPAAFPDEAETR